MKLGFLKPKDKTIIKEIYVDLRLKEKEADQLVGFLGTDQWKIIKKICDKYMIDSLKKLGAQSSLSAQDLKEAAERYRGKKVFYGYLVKELKKYSKHK